MVCTGTTYNDSDSGDENEDGTSSNNENVNNNDQKMTLISSTVESKIKQRHIHHFHLNNTDQLVEGEIRSSIILNLMIRY